MASPREPRIPKIYIYFIYYKVFSILYKISVQIKIMEEISGISDLTQE